MCGRYTLRTAPREYWPTEQLSLFGPRYNIAPSQNVPAVRLESAAPRLVMLRWGLVPSWANDEKIGYRTINARSESVAEKPAFRAAFRSRRCLLLADGYYEWKAIGKQKQPFFIHRQDDQPFTLAGLWESWLGPRGRRLDSPLETCTIITTESNELTADVHDRMPVILRAEDHPFWLDPEFQDLDKLSSLLRPYSSEELAMHPVSTLVNRPANESPECVVPL